MNIENRVIDILIARLSLHYDEVSLESGLIEIDTGNEQPPDTRIAAAIIAVTKNANFNLGTIGTSHYTRYL